MAMAARTDRQMAVTTCGWRSTMMKGSCTGIPANPEDRFLRFAMPKNALGSGRENASGNSPVPDAAKRWGMPRTGYGFGHCRCCEAGRMCARTPFQAEWGDSDETDCDRTGGASACRMRHARNTRHGRGNDGPGRNEWRRGGADERQHAA